MDEIDLWREDELTPEEKIILRDCDYYVMRPVLGKIVVLPEAALKRFQPQVPWAGISIIESRDFANGRQVDMTDANRVDILRLGFDDIPIPMPQMKHFDHAQAGDIWFFVKEVWDKVDLLMIHCYAGLSRSTAVAKAISTIYQAEHSDTFSKIYSPNPLVFRTMVEVRYPLL